MEQSHQVYKKGESRYTEQAKPGVSGYVHEIHDMVEKPGFIGKKVNFYEREDYNFEDFKNEIIKHSKTADLEIPDFLPSYYFTFVNNEAEKCAYYFMEDVQPEPAKVPERRLVNETNELDRIKQLDSLLKKAIEIFRKSYNKETDKGLTLDLQPVHIIYGKTLGNRIPKLYFIDLHPLTVPMETDNLFTVLEILMSPYSNQGQLEEKFPQTLKQIKALEELTGVMY